MPASGVLTADGNLQALCMDGAGRLVEGTGFEPVYAKRSDLQSDGFNHSPTPPHFRVGNEAHRVSLGGLWLPLARVSTPLMHLPKRNRAAGEKTHLIHRHGLAFCRLVTL